jgi:probable HAF family extracellular repeat protein
VRLKFGRGALCALAVCVTMGTAHADLIDLGTLGGATSQAWGIQSDGRVVVGVADNGSAQQAFAYTVNAGFTGGTMTALDFLTGGNAAEARAISPAGLIVGYSSDSSAVEQAVTWTGTAPTLIANTVGGAGARAFGVSTGGDVIGWANDSSGVQRAFVAVGGNMTALDLTAINSQHDPSAGHNARALGISPNGRYVVGEFEVDNGAGGVEVHGFVYDRTSPVSSYECSASGIGSACATNNTHAVGSIISGSDSLASFSVHSGGSGSADFLPSLGGTGAGNAINSAGLVVGSQDVLGVGQVAVLWSAASPSASVTDLDALYGTPGTLTLNSATGIADTVGVYTGWGMFGGATHGFLLTPSSGVAPEPTTFAFLALGGTLVIVRRRRLGR